MALTELQIALCRKVVLSNQRYLLFDHANHQWRVVLYRKREKGEVGNEPGVAAWVALGRASMVPLVPRLNYCRFAAHHRNLDIAIHDVLHASGAFGEHGELITYLESTEWGLAALDYVA